MDEIDQAVALLERSASGKKLIQKAMTSWNLKSPEELKKRFLLGEVSRTDAVLIRHYDPVTGKEERERKVTIYLRAGQPLGDMMLDLAHELVHATSRPSWDPYDPNLTPSRYIQAAIEGDGGEVDAVQMECQVSYELFGKTTSPQASRCRRYWNDHARDAIRKDFYRVGHWSRDLKRRLGVAQSAALPLLSDQKPELYSSTGGAPYPVALFEEYRQMTDVACANSKRREQSWSRDSASALRAPASNDSSEQENRLFLNRRCHP